MRQIEMNYRRLLRIPNSSYYTEGVEYNGYYDRVYPSHYYICKIENDSFEVPVVALCTKQIGYLYETMVLLNSATALSMYEPVEGFITDTTLRFESLTPYNLLSLLINPFASHIFKYRGVTYSSYGGIIKDVTHNVILFYPTIFFTVEPNDDAEVYWDSEFITYTISNFYFNPYILKNKKDPICKALLKFIDDIQNNKFDSYGYAIPNIIFTDNIPNIVYNKK